MNERPTEGQNQSVANGNDRSAQLFSPVAYIKGVGPSNAETLGRLGILRAFELLFFFPRDYQEIRLKHSVDELVEDEIQTVYGTIEDYSVSFTRIGQITTLFVSVGTQHIKANWFKVQYVVKNFAIGRRVLVTGAPKKKADLWCYSHPVITYLDDERVGYSDEQNLDVANLDIDELSVLPVYRLTEGMGQAKMRRIIGNALTTLPDLLPEALPKELLEKRDLPTIAEAIRKIHKPKTLAEAEYARRRFVYQELLVLQLALAICRLRRRVNMKATPLTCSAKIDSRIRSLFTFELTEAQQEVIGEIVADMGRSTPMNRLLQGDVGSGKTVVAIYAALVAVANGAQAVLMAPTEVLARQHMRTLQTYLRNSAVKVAPLFGGQKPSERSQILEDIRSGSAHIVVGTQALVYNEIEFHNLGLAIIDEQHKFGVKQRALLKAGTDVEPHYLVMTATPIPRSLTMTLFGDLDVSVMNSAPPGRHKTTTYVLNAQNRASWWQFVRERLNEGRQAYVVAPRVDNGQGGADSELWEGRELTRLENDGTQSKDFDFWNDWAGPEKEREMLRRQRGENEVKSGDVDDNESKLKTVWSVYKELAEGELCGYRLGIVHGRMTTAEKEAVMLDFRSGVIQVLIATSVVEVGVDVPNATIMTIENAERFGLAQLHQLRGRIARGRFPGFCAVAPTEYELDKNDVKEEKSDAAKEPKRKGKKGERRSKKKSKDEEGAKTLGTEEKRREEGLKRLDFFASTSDGFELSEYDFSLRGPGQLFGARQHGDANLKVADLARDRAILEEACKDAREIVANDPGLSEPELHSLQRQVMTRYGKELDLGDVG